MNVTFNTCADSLAMEYLFILRGTKQLTHDRRYLNEQAPLRDFEPEECGSAEFDSLPRSRARSLTASVIILPFIYTLLAGCGIQTEFQQTQFSEPVFTEEDTSPGPEPRPIQFYTDVGRPSGIYAMGDAYEPAVCDEMLQALNEERPWPTRYGLSPSFHGFLDVVIGSRLSLEWQEFGRPAVSLSYMVVDIDNDGRENSVFRYTTYLSGVQYQQIILGEKLPEGADIITSYRDYSRRSGENLDQKKVNSTYSIFGSGIDIDFQESQRVTGHRLGQMMDIVSVDNRNYLLAGASITDMAGHPLKVRLFEINKPGSLKLLCEFRPLVFQK